MPENKLVDDELLKQLKIDNDIPESDSSMDEKIPMIAENGIVRLNYLNGKTNVYNTPGDARSLLFAYVKYSLANALDDFWKNYQSDVVAFINDSVCDNYVGAKEENQ